jgi:hypothetical protein
MNDGLMLNVHEELRYCIDSGVLLKSIQTARNKPTKSFKQFYLEKLVCESPLRYDEWKNMPLDNIPYNTEEANLFLSGRRGEYINTLTHKNISFNIYKHVHDEKIDYVCIPQEFSQIIIGWVRLNIIDGFYATNGLWNYSETAKGLVFHFFINWLLPKYKTILSDIMTTPKGEMFWKKIAQYSLENNIECGIYNEDDKAFIKLDNLTDFETAWEDGYTKRIYIKV